ncbi:hypothetical protein HDU96_009350 [Phlyctochytrium bullatum]|nr:hypothetical protein HDU96_009350 [Phlyctochytrium bullatum]
MPFAAFLPGLHGVHVLTLGTISGMVFHTSFITGIIQYKNLPRHMFGNLQSAIGSGVLTLTTALVAGIRGPAALISAGASSDAVQVWMMAGSCVGALLNLAVVGPWSTRVMFDRHKLEKAGAPVPPEMNKKFGYLHGVSSLLNLGLVIACFSNSLWVGARWASVANGVAF